MQTNFSWNHALLASFRQRADRGGQDRVWEFWGREKGHLVDKVLKLSCNCVEKTNRTNRGQLLPIWHLYSQS